MRKPPDAEDTSKRLSDEQEEIVSVRSGFGREVVTMTRAEYDARSETVDELNRKAREAKSEPGGF